MSVTFPARKDLPKNSSPLCIRCIKLTTDRKTLHLALRDEKEKGLLVAEPYEQLKVSAEAGCALCSLLCKGLEKQESEILANTIIERKYFALLKNNSPSEDSSSSSFSGEPLNVAGFTFNSRLAGTGSNRWENDMEFRVYTLPDDAAAHEISLRLPTAQFSSENAFKVVRDWIHECSTEHEFCASQNVPKMPTRVLDLGDGSGSKLPRLQTTLDLRRPYVALSYCWGGQQTFTTSLNTFQDRCQGIETTDLPQTIQDAITCTRNLGLRYLWIDSLCIIQDSDSDKSKEISRMADIYANAEITISAACAESAWSGFLSRECSIRPPKLILPFHCFDGSLGSIYLEERTNLPEDTKLEDPIDKRAWTLQESVLSRRLLSFTSAGQLQWKCHTKHYYDGMRSQRLRSLLDEYPPPSLCNFAFKQAQKSPSQLIKSSVRVVDEWCELMKLYSKRHISILDDRPLAIIGIADQFQRELDGIRYLAGMWEGHLRDMLLWRVMDTEQLGPRPSPSLAPSWSWLSVARHVRLRASYFRGKGPGYVDKGVDFEVLGCWVTPASASVPFDQVSTSQLKVKGRMRNASTFLDHEMPFDAFKILPDESMDDTKIENLMKTQWLLVSWDVDAQSRNHIYSGLILTPCGNGTHSRLGVFEYISDWDRFMRTGYEVFDDVSTCEVTIT